MKTEKQIMKISSATLYIAFVGLISAGCQVFAQPAADPKPAATKADETKTDEPKAADPKPADPKPADPKASAQTPAEKFQVSRERWNTIDKRLNEIASKYPTAPAEEREVLKAEYTKLVADSQVVLPQLRKDAEAAFDAEPNKNNDVTLTLIGLVMYHVRNDEYDQALALGNKMIAAGCEEAVLYGITGVAAYRTDDYDTAEKYLAVAEKAKKLDEDGLKCLAQLPAQKEAWAKEKAIRDKEAKADDLPRVKIETNKGTLVIELFENEAPGAVGNFVSLVQKKYYDGLTFHRVLPGFMAQGGDPSGNGSGGPGYQIYCECNKPEARMHFRGSLSMAHAGPDTGGSQFFLTFLPTTQLNKRHTVFGRVIEGFDVLAKIQRRDPQAPNPPLPDRIVKAEVVRKRDHEYKPDQVK